MDRLLFSSASTHSLREARLLHAVNDPSFIRKGADNITGFFSKKVEDTLNPAAAREKKLIDGRRELNAFKRPNLFTEPTIQQNSGDPNVDRLIGMSEVRRAQEFEDFAAVEIPDAIRQQEPFRTQLFGAALTQADIDDYRATNGAQGRIGTLLRALQIIYGDPGALRTDVLANDLATAVIREKNDNADAPGGLYLQYEQWRLSKTSLGDNDATDPEILLKDQNLPKDIRAMLENAKRSEVPEVFLNAKRMLEDMNRLFQQRLTDDKLRLAEQRVKYMQLAGDVEKKALEGKSTDVLKNIADASLFEKAAMAGIGFFVVREMLKTSFGKIGLGSMAGYYAWDRFVNGNKNALNDMANKGKGLGNFAMGKLGGLGSFLGLSGPKGDINALDTMSNFITSHNLAIDDGVTGMAFLASVDMNILAGAWVPNMQSGQMGGKLRIDHGRKFDQLPNGTLKKREVNEQGNLLYTQLMDNMDKNDVPGEKKLKTIKFLEENNDEVGFAVGHMMFELGATEVGNMKDAEVMRAAISGPKKNKGDVIESSGAPVEDEERSATMKGKFNNLPVEMRERYMQIAMAGRELALKKYKGQYLGAVIATLNADKTKEVAEVADTADIINDPSLPNRVQEFATITSFSALSHEATKSEVLADGNIVDFDAEEFARNCVNSKILDESGRQQFLFKAKKIRENSATLSEAMETLEKFKYAVWVLSLANQKPLTGNDLFLMTGPDDSNMSSFLNSIGAAIARTPISVPRGFQSVSNLGSIRSILSEPLLGSGPVSSQNGKGFPTLMKRLDVYEKQLVDLKNPSLYVKQIADKFEYLVTPGTAPFDSRATLERLIQNLMDTSNFAARMNRSEKHLAQRMANSLARNMRLNANGNPGFGFGNTVDLLTISPNEEQNIAREFDVYMREMTLGVAQNGAGMWKGVEDIDALGRKTDTDAEEGPIETERDRLDLVKFSRDMMLVYLLNKQNNTSPAEMGKLRLLIGDRVETIKDRFKVQRLKDLKDKSKPELIAIANQSSYHEGIPQLNGILALLEYDHDLPIFPVEEKFESAASDVSSADPGRAAAGTGVATADPGSAGAGKGVLSGDAAGSVPAKDASAKPADATGATKAYDEGAPSGDITGSAPPLVDSAKSGDSTGSVPPYIEAVPTADAKGSASPADASGRSADATESAKPADGSATPGDVKGSAKPPEGAGSADAKNRKPGEGEASRDATGSAKPADATGKPADSTESTKPADGSATPGDVKGSAKPPEGAGSADATNRKPGEGEASRDATGPAKPADGSATPGDAKGSAKPPEGASSADATNRKPGEGTATGDATNRKPGEGDASRDATGPAKPETDPALSGDTKGSAKPGEGAATGDATNRKPGDGAATGDATNRKPGEGAATGDATNRKPGDGAATGDATNRKPGEGAATGDATNRKPGEGAATGDAKNRKRGKGKKAADAKNRKAGGGTKPEK